MFCSLQMTWQNVNVYRYEEREREIDREKKMEILTYKSNVDYLYFMQW